MGRATRQPTFPYRMYVLRDTERIRHSSIIPIPQSVQQNGSWYIHVFCVKSGFSLDPNDEDYSPNAMAYSVKRTNGLLLRTPLSLVV